MEGDKQVKFYDTIRAVFEETYELDRSNSFYQALRLFKKRKNHSYRKTADFWRKSCYFLLLMFLPFALLLVVAWSSGEAMNLFEMAFFVVWPFFVYWLIGYHFRPFVFQKETIDTLAEYFPLPIRQKLGKVLAAFPDVTINSQSVIDKTNPYLPQVIFITVALRRECGGNDKEKLVYIDSQLWECFLKLKNEESVDNELQVAATG